MQIWITFDFTASGILPFYWEPCDWYQLTYQQSHTKCLKTFNFRVLHNRPPRLYGHVTFSGPRFQLWLIMWCPCYMCAVRSAVDQIILDIWPILLVFGLINDLLLFVTGCRWCRSLAKVTKRVPIEKSKLYFIIPKTISVIPYPYNFLVSYPLSLKLFC